MTKQKTNKSRHFATIIYPESAHADFVELIENTHLQAFLSPLHENELEEVKPHYHLLLSYDGPTTYNIAENYFKSIGAVGCEVVKSFVGYARYLCHLDDPEKNQYNVADVVQFGGADYQKTIAKSMDRYKAIGDIMQYIDDTHQKHYHELLRFCRNERYDWFIILCEPSSGVVIKDYLKSIYHKSLSQWGNNEQ